MLDTEKQYDAIVVGSGASGSFAAMELTRQGLQVLLLEAGRDITPDDFPVDSAGPKEKGIQLWARARASVSGQPTQAKVAFYGQQQKHLFVNDLEHPYSSDKKSPFLGFTDIKTFPKRGGLISSPPKAVTDSTFG